MKKILVLIYLIVLSGCINAGNHDILGFRNDIFTIASGYKITFYTHEPVLIKTEDIQETNYKFNEAQTAYKGNSILSTKTYTQKVYAEEWVRANKNGTLSSPGLSSKYYAKDKYHLIGQVTIDGVVYRLVPDALEGYAFLINDEGAFYDKAGQIKDGYLILLDTVFFPYPKDLKMVNIYSSKAEQSAPAQGFELRYDGIRLDRVWFTYLDYASNNKGNFENISFPNKSGLITINGINMRIISADEDKITYMLMK